MGRTFKDIKFPKGSQYRTDTKDKPIIFYESAFPISTKVDMLLGYFSTNAIRALSYGIAEFIYNGGKLRIAINHELSVEDKQNLLIDTDVENQDKIIDILGDLDELKSNLSFGSQHFFDCLKLLLDRGDLEIIPIKLMPNNLSHFKNILWYDGESCLYSHGSANFTFSGILKNGESFTVDKSWSTDEDTLERIHGEQENFKLLFDEKNSPRYKYLKPDQVKGIIKKIGNNKNEQEILEDSKNLINEPGVPDDVKEYLKKRKEEFEERVKVEKKKPHFIKDKKGKILKPREYQLEAYKNWVNNKYKGIFAMATGTGKTLTAINCLIKECDLGVKQKHIFVVPGQELVIQWADDLKTCNFSSLYLWYSGNKKLSKDKKRVQLLKNANTLNIVITYKSFQSNEFLGIFKNNLSDFTVVFDEAHNMGASGFRKNTANVKFNRLIGLSATPLRLWDDQGENLFIEELFDSRPPYTYSLPMEKAIGKFLCEYYYYPYFTHLTDKEFEDYLYWTSQIPKGKDGKMNTHAALKRQLLLDKAENKQKELLEIIKILIQADQHKYTLVYCPKGRTDDEPENKTEDSRIIHELGEIAADKFKKHDLNIQFFVGESKDRDLKLNDFSNGEVDMLFAIKCLDEGVNVPIAQNAIFLASGKNYREFVQRRGRILRKYETDTFKKEHANIYDIIVLPTFEQYKKYKSTSKKLIISEFKRLFEFYKMSIYNSNIFWKIENELLKYQLTQYQLEELIKEEYDK